MLLVWKHFTKIKYLDFSVILKAESYVSMWYKKSKLEALVYYCSCLSMKL